MTGDKWTKEEVNEIMEKLNANFVKGNMNFLYYFVENMSNKNTKQYDEAINYAISSVALEKKHSF